MGAGSDLSKPGKRIIAKITASTKLVKMIISYSPEFTDTLGWTDDERKCFAQATVSKDLSDKLFATWLIARKIEGKPAIHETPKIIIPGMREDG